MGKHKNHASPFAPSLDANKRAQICTRVCVFSLFPFVEVGGLEIIHKRIEPNMARDQSGLKYKILRILAFFWATYTNLVSKYRDFTLFFPQNMATLLYTLHCFFLGSQQCKVSPQIRNTEFCTCLCTGDLI